MYTLCGSRHVECPRVAADTCSALKKEFSAVPACMHACAVGVPCDRTHLELLPPRRPLARQPRRRPPVLRLPRVQQGRLHGRREKHAAAEVRKGDTWPGHCCYSSARKSSWAGGCGACAHARERSTLLPPPPPHAKPPQRQGDGSSSGAHGPAVAAPPSLVGAASAASGASGATGSAPVFVASAAGSAAASAIVLLWHACMARRRRVGECGPRR